MSLLSWEKHSLAAERPAAGSTAELTPLHMTIVGALLIAVGPISMTLYTPALTLLTQVFSTDEHAIRTTITVYLFGFALAQLICGPLSDRFGRRPVVITCLGLYLLGSAICASATSVLMLDGGSCRASAPAAAWRCRA